MIAYGTEPSPKESGENSPGTGVARPGLEERKIWAVLALKGARVSARLLRRGFNRPLAIPDSDEECPELRPYGIMRQEHV